MTVSFDLRSSFASFWNDEQGLILSAELIIIVTLVVIGLITGLACLQQAVVSELQDVGGAIRGMNQSYATTSFWGCRKIWGRTSFTAGSRFTDTTNGFVAGATAVPAEIGTYNGGVIYDFAPSRPVVPQGTCTTCPVEENAPLTPTPATEPVPCTTCPLPTDQGAPTPIPEAPCSGCTPNSLPAAPRPEIPQGPAPQILPQG